MVCGKCGAENPDGWAYCKSCGAYLLPTIKANSLAPSAPGAGSGNSALVVYHCQSIKAIYFAHFKPRRRF